MHNIITTFKCSHYMSHSQWAYLWSPCPFGVFQPGLKISHHANEILKSFCKWQATINPKDENHPNHHDVAILLTRSVCQGTCKYFCLLWKPSKYVGTVTNHIYVWGDKKKYCTKLRQKWPSVMVEVFRIVAEGYNKAKIKKLDKNICVQCKPSVYDKSSKAQITNMWSF